MIVAIPAGKSKSQFFINQAYVDYLAEAGYEPLLVTAASSPEYIVRMAGALLLPGGIDLEPTFYGENNLSSNSVDPEKDDFERMLFHIFKKAGKPIFGICRGFQIIIREFLREKGGTQRMLELFQYYQHISSHNQDSSLSVPRPVAMHDVRQKGLYGDATPTTIFVNSLHHQGLVRYVRGGKKTPGGPNLFTPDPSGIQILAYTRHGVSSDIKGVIVEAVKIHGWGAPIFGVQWHPEEMRDIPLLKYAIEGAGADDQAFDTAEDLGKVGPDVR